LEEIPGAGRNSPEETTAQALLLGSCKIVEESIMDRRWKITTVAGGIAAFGVILIVAFIVVRSHRVKRRPNGIQGAIVEHNVDTKRESPIADVEISAENGLAAQETKSDFSGLFRLALLPQVEPGQSIVVNFHHPDYLPVKLQATVGDNLYVVEMAPVHGEVEADLNEKEVLVTNVLVRYSVVSTSLENIGSGVKTFQVANQGNIPCKGQQPCSPDGKWKAAIDSASLDSGEGNLFQNARVSCIAGPCPFTKIDSDGFSKPGRNISVSVRNWSDTTTFLLQAEVFRSVADNPIRVSYPVIFGRSLNFTLPADAQGPSLEAELDGSQIIFPLAPDPILSWADCNVRVEQKQAKDVRCELKSGYSFK
jgi:hypothetical protein